MTEHPVGPARWSALLARLGARQGDAIYAELEEQFAEPHRAYHTLSHVSECLVLFDKVRHLARRPDEVEAALWLHDVIYEPRARDNEAQSALWATSHLHDAGVPDERARCVGDLILATRHDEASLHPGLLVDASLVADIDLAILGAEPEQFDRYERQIRREYGWVPEDVFRKGRAVVLRGFLRRVVIYQTAHFREQYEASARENLGRSLSRLEA